MWVDPFVAGTDYLVNKAVYTCIWTYTEQCKRAITRCKQIAANETVSGYLESAAMYEEISGELYESQQWVDEILRSLRQPVY